MRAMCGAIITAGALIGLGLICLGIGTRYQTYPAYDGNGNPQFVYFRHLDTALMAGFVIAAIALVIGLGIAFLGLAYHHQRRHLEWTRGHHNGVAPGTTAAPAVGTTTTTSERLTP